MTPPTAKPDLINRAIKIANDLPPLSPIARRLLTTICSPGEEPSLGEIATWIDSDALTSGKVLALANSALYGRSVPILSVRVAVTRLGLKPLRSLILGSSLSSLWSQLPSPQQWSTSNFNAHSIATGVLCEIIASTFTPADSQLAFLAGLLHDTGRLLIAVLLHDNTDALARLNVEGESLEEAERNLVGFAHPELSAALIRSWNLPLAIENAIRHHEHTEHDAGRSVTDCELLMSDIVHVADCFADCHGFSITGTVRQDGEHVSAFSRLGVDETTIGARLRDELDVLLSIL